MLLFGLCLLALLPVLVARAAAVPALAIARDNPETMVREATSRLLDIAREARGTAKAERTAYYAAVEGVLEQVVDIEYFARGVMATYASVRLYNSLQSETEKTAFRARIERFVDRVKKVFMVKYADALLAFEGERIDLATDPSGDNDPDRASLKQTIYDTDGQTYVVFYSLHRDGDGGWRIRNVIVEGINLGLLYRDLFSEEVENHQGDVDYVVDHWVELMLQHDEMEKAVKAKQAEEGG